jgi:hypothetical protein
VHVTPEAVRVWRPTADRPALRKLFGEYGVRSPPNLALHTADDMFRFLLEESCGAVDLALFYYFRSALMARERINHVVTWWEGQTGQTPAILDFASGFGRVSRFLAADHGGANVTIAEIVAPAVEFQRRELGMDAVLSTSSPEALRLPRQFDLIVVLSLFSHLPASTFSRWLGRLAAQLSPRGALLVSTNAARTASSPEIDYETQSESSFLTAEEYGTTWIQESFFHRALQSACGPAWRATRFSKALWSLQDIWVVTADERLDLSALSLRRGPTGFLDSGGLTPDGRIALGGWAVTDAGGRARVAVDIEGGGPVTVRQGRPRPDAAAFVESDDDDLGWIADGPGLPWAPDALVSVSVSDGDARFLVHAATIEETILWLQAKDGRHARRVLAAELRATERELEDAKTREAAARRRGDELAATIDWMRQSRFWRARDSWWSLKERFRR